MNASVGKSNCMLYLVKKCVNANSIFAKQVATVLLFLSFSYCASLLKNGGCHTSLPDPRLVVGRCSNQHAHSVAKLKPPEKVV